MDFKHILTTAAIVLVTLWAVNRVAFLKNIVS